MNLIFVCDELKIIIVISFFCQRRITQVIIFWNVNLLDHSTGNNSTVSYVGEINFTEEIHRPFTTDISVSNLFGYLN
jgi:hypothetical protein